MRFAKKSSRFAESHSGRDWLDTNESAVETELAASQWWLERFILRKAQAKNGSNASKLDAFQIKTNYVQFFNVATNDVGCTIPIQILWGIFAIFPRE